MVVKIILKIASFIVLILVTIIALGFLFYYFDGKVGKGYKMYDYGHIALISNHIPSLHLGDILDWEYDDEYIIARRIPEQHYDCGESVPSIYTNKIQYLIIDKNTDKIYATFNEKDFFDFKKKMKIALEFSRSKKSIDAQIQRSKHIYDNIHEDVEYIKNNCKEKAVYPLIEIDTTMLNK